MRGFDAAAKRYKYEVNPRFGSTNPQFSSFRAPVTLTMQMRVDVGPTRERQQLTQQLDRGRTTTGPAHSRSSSSRRCTARGGILNPMAQILRQSDTLELTGPQADSLATMNRAYTVSLDSIWTPVAKYLADLPERYDQGEAYGALHRRAQGVRRSARQARSRRSRSLLTDEQRRKLPAIVASYLDTRYLAGIRSGTAGSAAAGAFGGGFIGGGGGGPIFIGGGGGGGGNVVIIRN